MANIEDYIAWRGDVTFEYDPFNVVDNLVFSALSYVDLEGILSFLRSFRPKTDPGGLRERCAGISGGSL